MGGSHENESFKDQQIFGADIAIPPTGEGLIAEKDVDVTVQRALQEAPSLPEELSAEDNRRVLRKLDLCLIPMMCLVVLFQFLDKSSLNSANLLGVKEDLNISGDQYSWLGSILYFGYLVASPVHGYFLQHVDLSRYASANVLLWGITLLCHAATFNFGSLATARFFLGVFEGSITPAFILLTGRFYTRREQIPRTAIWFSMNGWASIIGSLISYGLIVRTGTPNSLSLWQELFLILGALTFGLGCFLFFFMPSSPATTKYLTSKERAIAIERIRTNKTGINNRHFKREQLIEAVKDPRLYLFVIMIMASTVTNGCLTFGTAIIQGFGFSKEKTALLGMAPGATELVSLTIAVGIALLTKSRMVPAVLCELVAIVGASLMVGLPESNRVGRFSGYTVFFFFPIATPFIYSWLSSCIGGSSKKIVFNVAVQLGYCVGNIIGPQTYREEDAPLYTPAKVTMIAMLCVIALSMAAIGLVHMMWNKQRDRAEEFGGGEFKDFEFSDLTDQQIRSFRYPL